MIQGVKICLVEGLLLNVFGGVPLMLPEYPIMRRQRKRVEKIEMSSRDVVLEKYNTELKMMILKRKLKKNFFRTGC